MTQIADEENTRKGRHEQQGFLVQNSKENPVLTPWKGQLRLAFQSMGGMQ